MEGLNTTQKIVSVFAWDDIKQWNIISKRTKDFLWCNGENLCVKCEKSCTYFKEENTRDIVMHILNQSFYAAINANIK